MNDPFFDLRNHKEDIVLEFHFRIPEAATGGVFVKNVFLKITQIWQKSTLCCCLFWIKLPAFQFFMLFWFTENNFSVSKKANIYCSMLGIIQKWR